VKVEAAKQRTRSIENWIE